MEPSPNDDSKNTHKVTRRHGNQAGKAAEGDSSLASTSLYTSSILDTAQQPQSDGPRISTETGR
jgi:hypothetical protein